MKISFDFDGTLDREDVQLYAKKLLDAGHEVWITTARYRNNPHIRRKNNDLFRVANKVGIPMNKIIFCEMEPKWEVMSGEGFEWHLDDSDLELEGLAENTSIKAIDVKSPRWMGICESLTR